MKRFVQTSWLLVALSLTGSAVTTTLPRPAMAQGMEYCPDLGILVERTSGGFLVRAQRRAAITRRLGLQPGDLIFAINGQHPSSLSQLHNALFSGADNEDHDVDVLRGGQHLHAAIFHVNGELLVHAALH